MSTIYIYLLITAVVLVVEFLTTKLYFIWFAGGGVVAMILAAFGLEWFIHAPAFAVVSVALLIVFIKKVLKMLSNGQKDKKEDKNQSL